MACGGYRNGDSIDLDGRQRGGDPAVLKRRFVCSLDELPPGTMKLVDVGKFGVGVYNVRRVFARDRQLLLARGCSAVSGPTSAEPTKPTPTRQTGCGASSTGRSFGALGTTGNSTSPRAATSPTRKRRVRTYEVDVSDGEGVPDRMIIDTNVQPHFRYNAEIRRLPAAGPQTAGDSRRRTTVVSSAGRRLPPRPLRRALPGLGSGDRCPPSFRRRRGALRHVEPVDPRQHCRLSAQQPNLRRGQRLAAGPMAGAGHHRPLPRHHPGQSRRIPEVRSRRSNALPDIPSWSKSAFLCSPASHMASRCSSRSGRPRPRTSCRSRCTSTAATASTMRPRSPGTRTPIRATRPSCR